MCRSMVDIQSPTAEIRRGEKKKIEDRNHSMKIIYNGLPYSIGRPLLLLRPREWLQSIVISMSVCGSVCLLVCLSVCLPACPWGYLQDNMYMHDLYQFFCACCLCLWLSRPPTCLRQAASPIVGKGFSFQLKMHYRLGMVAGSAHRGQSMLSTIALLFKWFLLQFYESYS